MFQKIKTYLKNKLQSGVSGGNKAYAAACAFALAVLVPGAAFAAEGDWASAIEPKISILVGDITSIGATVVLVVIAIVGAKLIFSLLKKA